MEEFFNFIKCFYNKLCIISLTNYQVFLHFDQLKINYFKNGTNIEERYIFIKFSLISLTWLFISRPFVYQCIMYVCTLNVPKCCNCVLIIKGTSSIPSGEKCTSVCFLLTKLMNGELERLCNLQ